VEKRVLCYLPDLVNRIGSLVEFIEKYKVRLVIASAVTHEDHLCLLAAAKLANIKSLIVSHGFTNVTNLSLNNYCTHQATINQIEPHYAGLQQLKMKINWFNEKN
jgi:hypothetical protein